MNNLRLLSSKFNTLHAVLKLGGAQSFWAIVMQRPGFSWIRHRRISKTVSKSVLADKIGVYQTLSKKVSYVLGIPNYQVFKFRQILNHANEKTNI